MISQQLAVFQNYNDSENQIRSQSKGQHHFEERSIYGEVKPTKNSNWLTEKPTRNSKISFKKLD